MYSNPYGILAVESERRRDERLAADHYRLVRSLNRKRTWSHHSLLSLTVNALLTLIMSIFRT